VIGGDDKEKEKLEDSAMKAMFPKITPAFGSNFD